MPPASVGAETHFRLDADLTLLLCVGHLKKSGGLKMQKDEKGNWHDVHGRYKALPAAGQFYTLIMPINNAVKLGESGITRLVPSFRALAERGQKSPECSVHLHSLKPEQKPNHLVHLLRIQSVKKSSVGPDLIVPSAPISNQSELKRTATLMTRVYDNASRRWLQTGNEGNFLFVPVGFHGLVIRQAGPKIDL
jgi:hypothetical protein